MKRNCIKKDGMELDFLLGYATLSYEGIILSRSRGLYSSIYHNNAWYDSRFAIWQILDSDKNSISLYGEWANLPHRQSWYFKFEDGKLHWSIKWDNLNDLIVSMVQQNFMLIDYYTDFVVKGYVKGKFPEYFSNFKGLLWDRVWSMPQLKDSQITFKSTNSSVPDLTWISTLTKKDTLNVIENTGFEDSARILQLLFVNTEDGLIEDNCAMSLESVLKID
ncbi:MAG: hypothetical protein P9X27_03645 [Candidatus Kaelpia aquatica]|nr:hypothetical protein [Candidatus Kaelpia aquatica]